MRRRSLLKLIALMAVPAVPLVTLTLGRAVGKSTDLAAAWTEPPRADEESWMGYGPEEIRDLFPAHEWVKTRDDRGELVGFKRVESRT